VQFACFERWASRPPSCATFFLSIGNAIGLVRHRGCSESVTKTAHKFLLLGIAALFTLGTAQQAQAYYDKYPDGYWDQHGHYQHYTIYHHHRGYWDQRNGVRVFISF
jgi:hypothetical protein